MLELIKKTLMTGVGLAVVTKDKVEEIAKELVESGKLPEKEGRTFIKELLKKSEQAKNDLNARIEKVVTKVIGKINIVTKEDLNKIEKRVKRLEKAS